MFSVVMDRRIEPERGRLNTNALYYRVAGQVNLYLRRLRFGYVSMCPCVHVSMHQTRDSPMGMEG
jgi:hypothetical protein